MDGAIELHGTHQALNPPLPFTDRRRLHARLLGGRRHGAGGWKGTTMMTRICVAGPFANDIMSTYHQQLTV